MSVENCEISPPAAVVSHKGYREWSSEGPHQHPSGGNVVRTVPTCFPDLILRNGPRGEVCIKKKQWLEEALGRIKQTDR